MGARSDEIKRHLVKDIIPFWKGLKDNINGGFYGEMDYDLKLYKRSDKGGILNSRILWFFSNAYTITSDAECLACAAHAFEFMKEAFLDKENGGIYWSVAYNGRPVDTTKHTYNQAFAIYALASYYGATHNSEVLSLAYELVDKIETVCRDEIGYQEAFDRYFNPISNVKLSENGTMAARTMNTLLHVYEAYTELYRVDGNAFIADRMKWILEEFAGKVYNPVVGRLEVFFDRDMNSLINLTSYGHDIEASWLIDRGLEILGDAAYKKKLSVITKDLAAHIYENAYDGTSLYYECFNGALDSKKVWWVQAEAVLGFINAYQKDESKTNYLEAAENTWDFIKNYVIDAREGSEWLNEVDKSGKPINNKEIVGPWKCPYHNGRMCFEIIKRSVDF